MTSPENSHRKSRSIFLLISPSPTFEARLSCAVKRSFSDGAELSPWYVHWLLLAHSLQGWGDYMAWLEGQLREQVWTAELHSRNGVEDIFY